MRLRKTVLTTGEVARICCVAPRTVSKWVDEGHLRGYRIPGSKDRRIPLDQLVRFMRAHDIPMNGLEDGSTRILIVDADPALGSAIQKALNERGGYEVRTAATGLEAGAAAVELKPHVMIIDVTMPDLAPKNVTRFVRMLGPHGPACVIGTGRALSEGAGQALLQEGFDGYLSKPFDVRSLIHVIEEKAASEAAKAVPSA